MDLRRLLGLARSAEEASSPASRRVGATPLVVVAAAVVVAGGAHGLAHATPPSFSEPQPRITHGLDVDLAAHPADEPGPASTPSATPTTRGSGARREASHRRAAPTATSSVTLAAGRSWQDPGDSPEHAAAVLTAVAVAVAALALWLRRRRA